ncbi:MAG TPA: hypothetical protein DCZ10_02695 [Pelotomaculum sp.]|nr:hypothetical protein [Pelotomaculum sp.]
MRYIDLPNHLTLSNGRALNSIIDLAELLESESSLTSEIFSLLCDQDLEIWLRRIGGEKIADQVEEIRLAGKASDDAMVELRKILGKGVSGDGNTLIKALQDAQPGITLRIGAGVYNLSEPLLIQKSLVLEGQGKEQTRIVSACADSVLKLEGYCNWRISGIAFEHHGIDGADVVVVKDGHLVMNYCLCKGGSADYRIGGNGLAFLDGAKGEISRCGFRDNAFGILISGQSNPILVDNLCQDNKISGIIYSDISRGVARNNVCIGNKIDGICVVNQGQPMLEGNHCRGNQYGIAYYHSEGGKACDNECIGNDYGIYVDGQAQPALEGNRCRENKIIGIKYRGSSGGIARNNECSGNKGKGISVGEQAQPLLEGNRCRENKGTGISYHDSSGGTARGNECSKNEIFGIYAGEQVLSVLVGNRCYNNKIINIYDHRHLPPAWAVSIRVKVPTAK